VSSVFDDLPGREPMARTWAGKVAIAPTSPSGRIWVVLPDLDPHIRVGPCRWQTRNDTDLPARGDDCLVIFDNDREPWVVTWWPYDA